MFVALLFYNDNQCFDYIFITRKSRVWQQTGFSFVWTVSITELINITYAENRATLYADVLPKSYQKSKPK